MNGLWIIATLFASVLQVARNGLQRGLLPSAGPWGATLVRFLFGIPFSAAFVAVGLLLTPGARFHFSLSFWVPELTGAVCQVLAAASLLVAMRRAGFAVGTALQQSSLPLAAILGLLVFNDHLSGPAWLGVAITTVGLAGLTWPPRDAGGERPLSGAAFGLTSGLLFGFALNAFRHAGLTLEPRRPILSALACVAIVQVIQSVVLIAVLAARDRAALRAVIAAWRESLGAGLCGALASGGWFIALALAPAAPVRAVGMAEAPIAAIAGRRWFQERLRLRQILAGSAVLAGVVLTSLC